MDNAAPRNGRPQTPSPALEVRRVLVVVGHPEAVSAALQRLLAPDLTVTVANGRPAGVVAA